MLLEVADLSRFQFGLTAMYHWIFVPLTLGMVFLLAIMETTYVITGKQIYKDMVKFWGKLFAINFALGVATGLSMEFQFGTNWAYYSHYVGDIFGAPLAIEALMAFFLESTLIGLFFFGWNRLSKRQHLMVTWLVAIASNFSALWILVANGWMQNPVGAHFDYQTMSMQLISFSDVVFNPVAQVKFFHTVTAGYVTGAMFVLGISAYYMLKGRDLPFARRSFTIAATFGLCAIFATMQMGDESGHELLYVQKAKLAAMEAEWTTEPAPAGFNVIAFPNQEKMDNDFQIKVPYLLGIIATRSLDTPVEGLREIKAENIGRIQNGIIAYHLLEKLRNGETTPENIAAFDKVKTDLGYGLLVKPYNNSMQNITPAQIQQAANESIPEVAPLFWAFRIMVGCGMLMALILIAAFYQGIRGKFTTNKWVLRALLFGIPLPWIASEAGWFVAEFGRQPWAVNGILPVDVAASNLHPTQIYTSLGIIIFLYTVFLIAEMYLMFKFARRGPSSLKTGRYHFEQKGIESDAEDALSSRVDA